MGTLNVHRFERRVVPEQLLGKLRHPRGHRNRTAGCKKWHHRQRVQRTPPKQNN